MKSGKSQVWYGKYTDCNGKTQRKKLCANKTAAMQILAKLVTDAKLAGHGLGDRFAEHHARPLVEHLEDFAAALLADGDTPKHVRDTVARIRRIMVGCGFGYIRDLSASAAQTFLAWLAKRGRQRVELPAGKTDFTKAELVKALGVHPLGVAALMRRHGLSATGNGKARHTREQAHRGPSRPSLSWGGCRHGQRLSAGH